MYRLQCHICKQRTGDCKCIRWFRLTCFVNDNDPATRRRPRLTGEPNYWLLFWTWLTTSDCRLALWDRYPNLDGKRLICLFNAAPSRQDEKPLSLFRFTRRAKCEPSNNCRRRRPTVVSRKMEHLNKDRIIAYLPEDGLSNTGQHGLLQKNLSRLACLTAWVYDWGSEYRKVSCSDLFGHGEGFQ